MKKMEFTRKQAWELLWDGVAFLAGSFLFAVAVNVFTAPNNIAPGGLTGLATMINYLFGAPIGTTILVFNVPLFIWGVLQINFRFILKTLAATVISSVTIDLTAGLFPPYQGDLMLAALFSGVLSGAGLGLIFMRGGTTGGTDLVANLIGRNFRHLSLGKLVLLVDLVVVLISAFVYRNYESPLYAIINIFVSSKLIDAVLYGADTGTGKMMFIISPKNKEIAQRIMTEISRGVTELRSRGAYRGEEDEVLLCAVRRSEVYKTQDIIRSVDPDAFVIVGDAGQISGEGFKQSHKSESK